MKISYNWIKDYIKTDLEPGKLSQILTDIGLEVEGEETHEEVKGGLKDFFVGEVLTCSKHPNADKLSVTTVDVGFDEKLNIVCGAPNVAAGQKVIVATIGAELYMDGKSFTIKKTKLRGELSEGMICAEDEIGLGKGHDGILVLDADAKIGAPAAQYLNLKTDTVFEIGLTPNRVDAASHYGVARDLAAYFSQFSTPELIKPNVSAFKEGDNSYKVEVKLEDTDACKRYAGVCIKNVSIKPSPKWLQERLTAIGLNPINNVVDATNYVLHELGQPLHAFDADKLNGKQIVVKKMAEGTKFTTLDGEERILSDQDLMICDAQNAACIAGVFGGNDSGVTEQTINVFLESAYFDPVSVRKSAKRHGLSTDSSFRFERGVDPENTIFALKRAALLIQELAEGEISSSITDIYPDPIKSFDVQLNYKHVDRLIGKVLDRELINKILVALDIEIANQLEDVLDLKVPAYRVDVTREADVIEEILRIYGYNNVEFSGRLNATISPKNNPDNELLVDQVSNFMASNGFNEIMSNSLTKISYYEQLESLSADKCVQVINPLSSDLSVMRQTLLFNGLEAIQYNVNRQNPNLRLFEYGRCYKFSGKENERYPLASYSEERRIGIYMTGDLVESSWIEQDKKSSFFHLKTYCEQILTKLNIAVDDLKVSSLEDRKDICSGGIVIKDKNVNLIEILSVSPERLKQFDIEQEVLFAEIRWDELLKRSNSEVKFKEMSKFPLVRRDLALLLNEEVDFIEIEKLALKVEKNLLQKVSLFDFYQGKGIPEGKKSYGVSFYLQDETKTLTDKDIDRIMDKMTKSLIKEFDAELR